MSDPTDLPDPGLARTLAIAAQAAAAGRDLAEALPETVRAEVRMSAFDDAVTARIAHLVPAPDAEAGD